jgi:hypothetical protein
VQSTEVLSLQIPVLLETFASVKFACFSLQGGCLPSLVILKISNSTKLMDMTYAFLRDHQQLIFLLQRTEVYEYSKVLGNPQFILASFQPYKLIYASMLAEAGKAAEALRYIVTFTISSLHFRRERLYRFEVIVARYGISLI